MNKLPTKKLIKAGIVTQQCDYPIISANAKNSEKITCPMGNGSM
jgi:nitrate reductase alpha subunit